MGYSKRTSKYLKRIAVNDLTHMMSMINLMARVVKTLMKDCRCSLDKRFTKLIHMNP